MNISVNTKNLLLILLSATQIVTADSATWVGTGSGTGDDYDVLTNWDTDTGTVGIQAPATLPGAGEIATFDASGTELTVDFTSVPIVQPFLITVDAASYTFSMPNDVNFVTDASTADASELQVLSTGSLEKVGSGDWNLGNVRILEGGQFEILDGVVTAESAGSVVTVGDFDTGQLSPGKLLIKGDNVTPGSSALIHTDSTGFLQAGGSFARGEIEITDKGRLETRGGAAIGRLNNGKGSLTVSGEDSRWISVVGGFFVTNFVALNTTQDGIPDGHVIVKDGAYLAMDGQVQMGRSGDGLLEVLNSGQANFLGFPAEINTAGLLVGLFGNGNADSKVLVDGAGSELNVARHLGVAGGSPGPLNGHSATITVSNDGLLLVGEAFLEDGTSAHGVSEGRANIWERGTLQLVNGQVEIKGVTGGNNGTPNFRRDDNRLFIAGRLEGVGEITTPDLTIGDYRTFAFGPAVAGDPTGTIDPGQASSAGSIIVQGHGGYDRVTLKPNATFHADLFADDDNDSMTLDSGLNNPSLVVGGKLEVAAFGGYNPTSGETFTIISHESGKRLGGVFQDESSLASLPSPGAGEKWDVLYKDDKVIIQAVSNFLDTPDAKTDLSSIVYNAANYLTPVTIDGSSSVDPDSPTGIEEYSWTSDRDAAFLHTGSMLTINDISESTLLMTNLTSNLYLNVVDDDDQGGSTSVSVSYENSAPIATSVTVTPQPDMSVDILFQATDPDLAVNTLITGFENLTYELATDPGFSSIFSFGNMFPDSVLINLTPENFITIFGSPGTVVAYARVTDKAGTFDSLSFELTVVPEPSTYALLGTMLLVIARVKRNRKAQRIL